MISVYEDVVRSMSRGPEQEGDATNVEFVFRNTFAGFDGHFPGNPIVPGIVQIYAAQIAAEAASRRKTRLQETARCKFMRPVLPDEIVRVSLAGKWEDGFMRCKVKITANGEQCSSMTLVLESLS